MNCVDVKAVTEKKLRVHDTWDFRGIASSIILC